MSVDRLLLSAYLLFIATAISSTGQQETKKPETITLPEAEILVYLLPDSHDVRAQGMEVAWVQDTGPELNHKDYFYFFVYNAKRQYAASVTIGHFAVDKHTGEVWDSVLWEKRSSPEIEGVQRIIRKAHAIGPDVLEKFKDCEPQEVQSQLSH